MRGDPDFVRGLTIPRRFLDAWVRYARHAGSSPSDDELGQREFRCFRLLEGKDSPAAQRARRLWEEDQADQADELARAAAPNHPYPGAVPVEITLATGWALHVLQEQGPSPSFRFRAARQPAPVVPVIRAWLKPRITYRMRLSVLGANNDLTCLVPALGKTARYRWGQLDPEVRVHALEAYAESQATLH